MRIYDTVQTWEDVVLRRRKESVYKSRTCSIFNRKTTYPCAAEEQCPCGRMIRRHSFSGESVEEKEKKKDPRWTVPTIFKDKPHSDEVPIDVFGTLSPSNCKFVRIDTRTNLKSVYELILDDCGRQKPSLVISIYGGAQYFMMTERLEKEFIRGVINAATVANGWILTAGINNGVSKVVGEGIANYRLLQECPGKVMCIGLTMWSTVNEATRLQLKCESRAEPKPVAEQQTAENVQDNNKSIEQNHSHCILFDSGKLTGHLSDSHRDMFIKSVVEDQVGDRLCYTVTIMVEGGLLSLEVVENDIKAQRPIVLIQGSGRLADVLALLIEMTSDSRQCYSRDPTDEEIADALNQFIPTDRGIDLSFERRRIKAILHKDNRYLLHVFCMDRDKNVTEIIFNAIFTVIQQKKELAYKKPGVSLDDETNQLNIEDQLVDLALEWNYFDGVLPTLQEREFREKYKKDFMRTQMESKKKLFKKSLEKNRPAFIEFLLTSGFDPSVLLEDETTDKYNSFVVKLYEGSHRLMSKNHQRRLKPFLGTLPFKSTMDIDKKLNKLVGAFFGSIYSSDDTLVNRVQIDLRNRGCSRCSRVGSTPYDPENNDNRTDANETQASTKYTKYTILRDLFLWSILMDMPEMTKVLLLHIRSRICGALVASAIFKRYSLASSTADLREKFQNQASDFETYAAVCINICYEYNERKASELLLRQVPLFGKVTCMQVAVSSESGKLLQTACFDGTLNYVWFDKLSVSNKQTAAKGLQMGAILSLGFLAPLMLNYQNEDDESLDDTEQIALSDEGINYYTNRKTSSGNKCKTYWTHFMHFHECSMIKMCYHFLSYIWFLLVFSYMMLYHLDGRNKVTQPHWSEIYVIITVSSMFIDEVRKNYREYRMRMMEQWGSTGSTVLTVSTNIFYILPYFLFFLGLGFRYGSYSDAVLSTARIIWALDLELWYLNSLKFVMALRSLGPKLLMLKNMFGELLAFVYIIFIAITAYGVVSRSLFLYNQVPFTGQGIFSEILYKPYWFMYGAVADKDTLDSILNGTDPAANAPIAEATATHVLLAFHMLFINILLLNLLIAVFAFTIDKVQENTEFYWRYQRYSFVREYFERIPLAYPPLILISHILLLILAIPKICCLKSCQRWRQGADKNMTPLAKRFTHIFKMIPSNDSQYEQWDLFENAATHSYVRSILEKRATKDAMTAVRETSGGKAAAVDSSGAGGNTDQQALVNNLRSELMNEFKSAIRENQRGMEQMKVSLEWMMSAMERVKMNKSGHPKPIMNAFTAESDVLSTNPALQPEKNKPNQ